MLIVSHILLSGLILLRFVCLDQGHSVEGPLSSEAQSFGLSDSVIPSATSSTLKVTLVKCIHTGC
jgi:hypothetical protein